MLAVGAAAVLPPFLLLLAGVGATVPVIEDVVSRRTVSQLVTLTPRPGESNVYNNHRRVNFYLSGVCHGNIARVGPIHRV